MFQTQQRSSLRSSQLGHERGALLFEFRPRVGVGRLSRRQDGFSQIGHYFANQFELRVTALRCGVLRHGRRAGRAQARRHVRGDAVRRHRGRRRRRGCSSGSSRHCSQSRLQTPRRFFGSRRWTARASMEASASDRSTVRGERTLGRASPGRARRVLERSGEASWLKSN
jgi:hypothetical protein